MKKTVLIVDDAPGAEAGTKTSFAADFRWL
jgi:hypothetical protein